MAHTVSVRRTIPLSVEQTFAILSDHNRLGSILGLPCKRTRDGEGHVNGLGSVRQLGVWPLDFDETVTGFELNTRIDYRITRGSPLRNHSGSVRFEPAAKGTQVSWDIEFDLVIPMLGGVLAKALQFGIARGLSKIGR